MFGEIHQGPYHACGENLGEPDVAKEIVGLEPSDPPPNVELEALHEEYTESVVEEAYSEDVDPYTTTNKGVG